MLIHKKKEVKMTKDDDEGIKREVKMSSLRSFK